MWVFYAFLAAFFAGIVAIFGKIGLKGVDSTLATTVRGVIMAIFLLAVSLGIGKFRGFSVYSFTSKEWIFIALSGIAGALSWIAYFFALQHGTAGAVTAVDKLSIVFTVIFAALFLREVFTWEIALGAVLMSLGAMFIALPWDKIKGIFTALFS
jgi:transporter family protein